VPLVALVVARADAVSRTRLRNLDTELQGNDAMTAVIATDTRMLYLVRQPQRGLPLATIIQRCGTLPLVRAADLSLQILAKLTAMHAVGAVHGDLQSANIVVDPRRDGSDIVTVTSARTTVGPGTDYMAPELARGEAATPASDIYAAGIVLYEMLAGTTPARDSSWVIDAQFADRPIPLAFMQAIMKALEPHPALRHHSAKDFAAAIAAATPFDEPFAPWQVMSASPSPRRVPACRLPVKRAGCADRRLHLRRA
jgi:serine/threonine-protein kinase